MPDRISICNTALGFLGVDPISSFEDGSVQADLCARVYEQCVREMLEDHPWNFAEATDELTKDAGRVRPDFAYSYTLPVKYISARFLMTPDGRQSRYPYRISNEIKLCTDLDNAWLCYTMRVGEHAFRPLFVASLQHLVASRLAGPLTEVDAKTAEHFQLHMTFLARARNRDSMQDSAEVFQTDALVAWHAG